MAKQCSAIGYKSPLVEHRLQQEASLQPGPSGLIYVHPAMLPIATSDDPDSTLELRDIYFEQRRPMHCMSWAAIRTGV